MSSPNANEAAGKPVLSEKQFILLATVMQNIKGTPDIDWENVTSQLGYNNVRVTKELYRQIKKKMEGANGAPGAASGCAEPKTPSRVGKRAGRVGAKAPGSAKTTKDKKFEKARSEEEEAVDSVNEDPFVV